MLKSKQEWWGLGLGLLAVFLLAVLAGCENTKESGVDRKTRQHMREIERDFNREFGR